MLVPFRLPKTLLWVLNLLVIFLVMFTSFRLITLIAFKPQSEQLVDTLPSFFLGLRFDLRWISMILLPIVVFSTIPQFSPYYSNRTRKVWTWYLALVTFLVFFFFAADFGAFSYNATRLNADALVFMEDPEISAKMLWQSYPVVWMLVALFVSVVMLRWMFRKLHGHVRTRTDGKGIPYQRKWFFAAGLVLVLFIHGRIGVQPLRWNLAFSMNDNFKSYLALNPLQNFFTTLKFRKSHCNEAIVKENFPIVAAWVGMPDSFPHNRTVVQEPRTTRPNVVLVLCESFSMYKSSMSGNPLNTTPYFQSLSNNGVFFERAFTPHFSTARGLFATITGIPDVQLARFSTRNPEALNQHTIINNFTDYSKLYFLGGSPSFNNFEGLLKNIDGLQMYTEGKFESKPVNVWGISDKDLFMEANKVFARQEKPFFAIVQTADNHRPFMIPRGESEFREKFVSDADLRRNGFGSLEEYNSFRYADFCIQKFMEAARKETYFDNTVFVFVGDHGVSGDASSVYPDVWTRERLTDEHVPLLFYAPKLLAPQKRPEVVSQIDVLPTVAGIAGQSYQHTTLGRDLLNKPDGNNYAFIIQHAAGKIGMVTDDYYFIKNLNFDKEELHFLNGKRFTPHQQDSIRQKLSAVTSAYYETARWMLMNNKKS
jgi:phosphoglycerol transferase MdoB-like AlkP superfamily enzyme